MTRRLSFAVLFLVLAPGAEAGTPNVEKIAKKCDAGGAKDCAELVALARTHSDFRVREAAVARVKDQAVLAEAARKDTESAVRAAAVGNLTDQAALAEVATKDKNSDVRLKALGLLTDQAVLAEIIKADSSAAVFYAAFPRLTGSSQLADIARNHADAAMRKQAVEKLSDQVALADLASTHKDLAGRLAAIARLTDQEAVVRLARSLPFGNYFETDALMARIADQAQLADLAANAVSTRVVEQARARLAGGAALAELLKKDTQYSRVDSPRDMLKIEDQDLLADVASTAKTWEIRRDAVRKLQDMATLSRIAKGDVRKEVRDLALARLTALRNNVVVTGILVEQTVGRPLGGFSVDLGSFSRSVASGTTAADGRFTFSGVEAGKWKLQHGGYTMDGPNVPDVVVPASGRVDVGTVTIRDDAFMAEAFGSLCTKPGPANPMPPTDLLVFQQRKGAGAWMHSYGVAKLLGWTPPWKAAICIEESEAKVGKYVDRSGGSLGDAVSVSWDVRLIRLSDGKAFATVVTAEPPKESRFGMERGSPVWSLATWLKGLDTSPK